MYRVTASAPSGRKMDTSESHPPAGIPGTPRLTAWPAVASNTTSPILLAVPSVATTLLPPRAMRPVKITSAAVNPGGGTKKSSALCPVPPGCVTTRWPDVAAGATATASDVDVALLALARARRLKVIRLRIAAGSKSVPVIDTLVPGVPTVGVKLVMVGAPPLATVKGEGLLAEPPGAVTAIDPVVAPTGTVVTSWVALAAVTVAAVPLNVTVFEAGVALNPVPEIVTAVPTGPAPGVTSMTLTVDEVKRVIPVRLPTASY